jgi:hypothetical protein
VAANTKSGAQVARSENPVDNLGKNDFSARLNQTFRIHFGEDAVLDAELTEVQALGPAPDVDADWRQAFSILFRVSNPDVFPQHIYTVEHKELGRMELFLVPMGPDQGGGMRYEAVFA